MVETDFVPFAQEITVDYAEGTATTVAMHDGSRLVFRKRKDEYDPTDWDQAHQYLQDCRRKGEIATGLLFINPDVPDLHAMQKTPQQPLNEIPFERLCPGAKTLDAIQQRLR